MTVGALVAIAVLVTVVVMFRRQRSLLHTIRADIAEARIDRALTLVPGGRTAHLEPEPARGSDGRGRDHLRLVVPGTRWVRNHPGGMGVLAIAMAVPAAAWFSNMGEQESRQPEPAPSVEPQPSTTQPTGPTETTVSHAPGVMASPRHSSGDESAAEQRARRQASPAPASPTTRASASPGNSAAAPRSSPTPTSETSGRPVSGPSSTPLVGNPPETPTDMLDMPAATAHVGQGG